MTLQNNNDDYMKRFNELLEIVESARKDFEKFYKKGNKSAGVRLRKKMQDIRSFAKSIRMEVQEINRRDAGF